MGPEVMNRRVEVDGFIRWYVGDECVVEVTTQAYYQGGHVHPEDCQCSALVHSFAFKERLRLAHHQRSTP